MLVMVCLAYKKIISQSLSSTKCLQLRLKPILLLASLSLALCSNTNSSTAYTVISSMHLHLISQMNCTVLEEESCPSDVSICICPMSSSMLLCPTSAIPAWCYDAGDALHKVTGLALIKKSKFLIPFFKPRPMLDTI